MSDMTPPTLTHQTVECPHCSHAVAVVGRQSAFCPHCGRPLRRGHGRRTAVVVIVGFLLLAVAAGGYGAWHDRRPLRDPAIASLATVDPVDVDLADAIAVRTARAADLDRRADEVRAVRQSLVDQTADLSNLSARVSTAITRAADEDRWPAKVAGRSFSEDDARDLLARIAATSSAERQAIDRDAQVLADIAAAADTVWAESADLTVLRQDLAAGPTADQRIAISRRIAAYLRVAHLPDGADLTADPTRPVDVDALMH